METSINKYVYVILRCNIVIKYGCKCINEIILKMHGKKKWMDGFMNVG